MTFLAFAYSLVLIAGLLTELNWRAKMDAAGCAAEHVMSILWIATLLTLSSPFFNSWAISAKSQEELLLSGRIDAKKFDFGYMHFKLGKDGDAALARLEAADAHPQIDIIRAESARARAALSYWEYKNPVLAERELETPASKIDSDGVGEDANAQPGPMDLELDPDDAPDDSDGG